MKWTTYSISGSIVKINTIKISLWHPVWHEVKEKPEGKQKKTNQKLMYSVQKLLTSNRGNHIGSEKEDWRNSDVREGEETAAV